jgi:hypothetical protein
MKKYSVSLLLLFLLLLADISVADNSKDANNTVASGNQTAAPAQMADQKVMTDINDINPPEQAGFNKKMLYWVAGVIAVIFLIALIIFLVDYFIRRRKGKNNHREIILTEPHIEALNQLLMLKNTAECEDRIFYFTLTAILKRYLERRFSVDTMEKTTQELLPVIRNLSFDRHLMDGIKELLNNSDPVKYAKTAVEAVRREMDLAFVNKFIEETKPVHETQADGNDKNK